MNNLLQRRARDFRPVVLWLGLGSVAALSAPESCFADPSRGGDESRRGGAVRPRSASGGDPRSSTDRPGANGGAGAKKKIAYERCHGGGKPSSGRFARKAANNGEGGSCCGGHGAGAHEHEGMHEHQGTGGHQHGPSFAQLVAAQARYHQQLVADSTAALPGPSAPPSPVEGVGVGGLSDLVALRLLHRDPWLSAMLETQPRLHAHSLSVRGVLSWARGLPGGLYQTVRHPWRSLGELSRWIADYVTLSVWPDAVGVSGPLAPLVAAATLAGWLLWETAEHTIGGAWGWCTGPLNPALALPIAVATIGGVRKKLTDPWLSGARWAAITDDLLHPLRVTTSDGALRRASLAKSYGPGSGHGEVEALLGMGAVVPLLHRWGLIQPASQAGSPAGTEPGGSLLSQATALLAPDRPREDRLRSARTLAQDLTLLNRTLKLTVLAGKTEGQLTSAQARVLATARGRLLGTTRQLAYELEVTGRLDAEVLDEVWSQRRVALADGLGALLAANQALVDSLFAASQSAPTDTQPVQAPDELIERAAAAAKALRDRPRPRSAPDEPCVAGAPC